MRVCKGKTKNFGQKILGTKRPLNESSNEEVDRLCVHRIIVNPNHFLTNRRLEFSRRIERKLETRRKELLSAD